MSTTITLKDIAQKLNISVSTVSRALKDHPRIGPHTKRRVIAYAKEVGYFEKKFGHVLDQETNAIGVIVPKIRYHLYANAISGIEEIAEAHGMHIIICQSNESYEREKSLVKQFMDLGVAGLLVSIAGETKKFAHFEMLKSYGIPLVFFNRLCDEVHTDKVVIDNFRAAHNATTHLISVGCKRIAYLGGPEGVQISNTRMQGYKNALERMGLPFDESLVAHCSFDRESRMTQARKLLYAPNYPDGILAFSDQIAISLMIAAKERGLRIPEDISIVGFNNEPVDELLQPSLTSIEQPGYQMGREAAKLVLRRRKDPHKVIDRKVLSSHLIIRESTNKNKR
ncbi:LacI family DNA-binding transcriptional regulator [Ulvibacterium sp.]|uniref:LacI family DNA-binding transcriptional regulator n=1 Tax=Ulvibacterium sp. TaxID=2665914 RepID=UPI003BAC8D89